MMDIPNAISSKKRKNSSVLASSMTSQTGSTVSSTGSSSSSPNWADAFVWKPKVNPWDHLLMRENSMETWDPTMNDRQRRARRRIKKIIFDNLEIDWKSIPALEESQLKHSTLLHFEALRCKSSRNHFGDIVRQHYHSPSADSLVVVDGEEMVDMIG